MINRVVLHSKLMGLYINVSKTKLMMFSKIKESAALRTNCEEIEHVSFFKYLGATVNQRCNPLI